MWWVWSSISKSPVLSGGALVVAGLVAAWKLLSSVRIGKPVLNKSDWTRMGFEEWYHAASHRHGVDKAFVIVAALEFPQDCEMHVIKEKWHSACIQALKDLIKQHPLLQHVQAISMRWPSAGKPDAAGLRPRLVPHVWEETALEEAICWHGAASPDAWESHVVKATQRRIEVATLHGAHIDGSQADFPMRVDICVHPADCTVHFIFSFHHGIIDGVAGAYLSSKFLQLLSGSQRSVQASQLQQRSALEAEWELRPTLAEYLLAKVSRLWFKPSEAKPPNRPFLGAGLHEQQANPVNREQTVVFHTLPPSILHKLHAVCKQRQSTIQGALMAAATIAIWIECGNSSGLTISSVTPVNKRPAMYPPYHLQNLRSMLSVTSHQTFISAETGFWTLAKEESIACRNRDSSFRADLLRKLNSDLDGSMFLELANTLPNGRDHSLSISNLGRVILPSSVRDARVRSCYFFDNRCAAGAAVSIQALSPCTTDVPFSLEDLPQPLDFRVPADTSPLCLSFSSPTSVMSRETFQNIVLHTTDVLRVAISAGPQLQAHELLSVLLHTSAPSLPQARDPSLESLLLSK